MDDDEPCVGVFWGVCSADGEFRPLIEHVPLSDAEPYGECLTFAPGHSDVWRRLRRMGALPSAICGFGYDEVPRGRVVYHEPSRTFWIYADRRLQGAAFVAQIMRAFGLVGRAAELRSDSHYR